MTDNIIRKPIYKKWWFYLGLILLVAIGIAAFKWWQLVYRVELKGAELDAANVALSNGISIDDKLNDFVIMEKNDENPNENNPSPYRIQVADIKNMTFAADGKYLYIKVQFYDQITKSPPTVNGDPIEGMGAKVDFLDKPMGKNLVVLHLDFGWWPILGVPVVNTYYSTGPTGIEWPESARFTTENRDSKIAGGAGYDYIISAYPLKTLGYETGDTINIDLQTEAKSAKWDHAAVDVLQGTSKTPGLITWRIGSNAYSIQNFEETGDNQSAEKQGGITDFESCAKQLPVLETNPEQCKTPDGKTYTKKK